MTIRLLLVDDQEIFRRGLAKILGTKEDLIVIGQAPDGQAAIILTDELQPDVILMDIRMPVCDGVKATREIHQRYPWIKIIVLTTFDDDEYIWQSLQAGAIGYLLKRTPIEQITVAIQSAYQGYSQLGPTIASKIFGQMPSVVPAGEFNTVLAGLSKRELEVLRLIAAGKNNQEISRSLHLTEGTVRNYITNILSQLDVRDRVQAILWAQKNLTDF
jgi:DNA-binding NarL/FixJ family response regulator